MTKTNFKKINLIQIMSDNTGYSKMFSKKIINDLIESLITTIKKEDLNLKNFGKFSKIHKRKRMGRNPKTKEPYLISSRISIRFIPSSKLIVAMNN